jgi:hypothetical protein
MRTDRNALMIIRAWVEEGSAKPLRVQVRLTGDVSSGFERSASFAESADVCALVDAWLNEVVAVAQAP